MKLTRLKQAEKLLKLVYDELGPKSVDGEGGRKNFGPTPPAFYVKNAGQWDFDAKDTMLKVAKFLVTCRK